MSTLLAINNYHYLRGGGEGVFFEHNRLLAERGWNIVPFSMQHPDNRPSPWSSHFVEELEFGGDHSPLEKVRLGVKSVYSLEARHKLRSLIDRVQPTLAHCHNIYHHLSPSILHELKAADLPVVLTLHDLKLACPSYKMRSRDEICERCKGGNYRNVILRRCMKDSLMLSSLVWFEATLHRALGTYEKCVDRFVVPSRFLLAKMVEWGWPEERFTYIPNCIDPDRFTPSGRSGRYFLFLGRLSEEKGLQTLIRAVAASGVKAVIAGEGPLRSELETLARELGAEVTFAGFVRGQALTDLIADARAVVLPSIVYENAPLSVLEASASGKPVIGSRIGGIPELIVEGQTGHTFAADSVEELAATLRTYEGMTDSSLIEMGRAGREWVTSRFTAARYAEAMTGLYNGLLAGRSTRVVPVRG